MITKTRNILAALVTLLALGVISLNHFALAQANRPQSRSKSDVAKWEYCAITEHDYIWDNNSKKAIGRVIICFFQESGCRENLIRTEPLSDESGDFGAVVRAEKKAFVKAIAQLGDEGWELIGSMPFTKLSYGQEKEPTVLYFKRAKQ